MHTFILILLWRIIKSLARLASRLQYTEPAVVSPAQKDLHGDWKRVTKSVGDLRNSDCSADKTNHQHSLFGGGFSSPHSSSLLDTFPTNALDFLQSHQQHDQHDHIYGTKLPSLLLLNDLSITQVGDLLTYHKIRPDAFVAEGVNGEILSEIISIEDMFQYDINIKHAPARVFLRYLGSYRSAGVPLDRLPAREACQDVYISATAADRGTANQVLHQRTDDRLPVTFVLYCWGCAPFNFLEVYEGASRSSRVLSRLFNEDLIQVSSLTTVVSSDGSGDYFYHVQLASSRRAISSV